MVVESPPPQEQPLPASTDSLKSSLVESQAPTSEPGPMASTGESTVNGAESGNESQRQQHPGHMANGVSPAYPYPPPPGSLYPMGMPHEMFQGGPGVPGQRMMLPIPYPYPPPQPGQPGQPMPPNGYAFPTMMPPPPPPGNGSASPSSPSAPPVSPYGYGMWYSAPGAPPGPIPQNGMQPIPMPMGTYPPPQPMYLPPQHHGDGQQNGGENGGPVPKPSSGEQHTNGVTWTPGPGGLPPKAVAQTIPCRYFPDCRFGSSCWFLHPGADPSNPPPPSSNQQDPQPPRPFFTGSLPPPVRYGPHGPWDPSSAPPNSNENPSDANKSSYPSPMAGPNAGGFGLMYAPYPYPNGYPPMYPPPTHSQQSPNGGTPQSPPQSSQPMSPQHMPHQLQQNPPSQPQSPPPNMPAMYQVSGTQGGWFPGQFPPGMPVQLVPMQSMSPPHHAQGMVPISPVSPSMGPNGTLVQGMVMPPQPMSPNGASIPLHSPRHHPGQVPYPISPPYTSAPMHPHSPPQQAHPISPQTHPASPQSPYGNQPPHSPSIPVMPPRGHHSRRESMSSMSAVPMGQVLGPNLDGNGTMDGSRSPPSAFREMMDGGYGAGVRRGRGGHSSRGSWTGGGSVGPVRKMPCAFFPSGKCKNGDQCRFPHIMPAEGSVPVSPTSPRGGYPGSFGRVGNGSRRPTILGPTIEDRMADLSVKEVDGQENGDGTPRIGGFPKPYSSSPKTRGGRPSLSTPSTPGHRQNTHLQSLQLQQQSQRIPSADDFPVLGGTATPPPPAAASIAIGNGHGYPGAWSGPTAAQVLKSGMTAKKAGGPHAAGSSVNGDMVKGTTDGPETTVDDCFRAPEAAANTAAVEAPA